MKEQYPCPSCGSPCYLTAYPHSVRRGDKVVSLDWHQFTCQQGCRSERDGEPLSFVTEAVSEADRKATEAEWKAKYDEAIPAPGKSGRPTRAATASNERVPVKFTREELNEIDRRRGEMSRSAFVRYATLGRR